ncbi:hypothetical protein A3715_10670 [Oleiphilus sp. HI0009]|nr:hypothetical protein A3715_10670 [Oleiphilus sp. HI0009]
MAIRTGRKNRFEIKVLGLGSVMLNKTSEGLIVDVIDKLGVSLGTCGVTRNDFEESYSAAVNEALNKYEDVNAGDDYEFSCTAFGDELSVEKAVTSWFQDGTFKGEDLVGIHQDFPMLNIDNITNDVVIVLSSDVQKTLVESGFNVFKTRGNKALVLCKIDDGGDDLRVLRGLQREYEQFLLNTNKKVA